MTRLAAATATALRNSTLCARFAIPRSSTRHFCNSSLQYAEDLQKAQIKPTAFYEEQGALRNYFYHVDLQGRLFVEDIIPKNVATCLKSEKFLRFFFRNLQPNTLDTFNEYAFISPCGKEMNFIRPADTPICFNELKDEKLFYAAGSMSEDFDPAALTYCLETHRLYHPIRKHARLKGSFALISSHLAVRLSATFEHLDSGEVAFQYAGKVYVIETKDGAKQACVD